MYASRLCLYWYLTDSSCKIGYFDNKYFWNWSDECWWHWININVSKFLGFFVWYFWADIYDFKKSLSFLPKMHFLGILEIFRLDIGQISFNLVKKASATWQLAFLPLASRFMTFWLRHAKKSKFWDKKIKWPTSFQVRPLYFLNFFSLFLFPLFFSFCCSDCPSNGLACS